MRDRSFAQDDQECLSQAAAAVSRACTVLSKDEIQVGGIVSVVDQEKCASCLSCVRVCPYNVPVINSEGMAEIELAKCRGAVFAPPSARQRPSASSISPMTRSWPSQVRCL